MVASIRNLTLPIQHNSAVGLVDRLAAEGLVVRQASAVDRRKVELHLSSHGREVLGRLAKAHRDELRRIGPILGRVLSDLAQDPRGDSDR